MNASTELTPSYLDEPYYQAVPTTRLVWPVDEAALARIDAPPSTFYLDLSVRARVSPISEPIRFLIALALTGVAMWFVVHDIQNQGLAIFLAFLVGGCIWGLYPKGSAS